VFNSRWGSDFPSLDVKTGPGAHPASYAVGNAGPSPGLKRPGREAYQSIPTDIELNPWTSTSTPPIRFHSVLVN
jgi:hypothetical protein